MLFHESKNNSAFFLSANILQSWKTIGCEHKTLRQPPCLYFFNLCLSPSTFLLPIYGHLITSAPHTVQHCFDTDYSGFPSFVTPPLPSPYITHSFCFSFLDMSAYIQWKWRGERQALRHYYETLPVTVRVSSVQFNHYRPYLFTLDVCSCFPNVEQEPGSGGFILCGLTLLPCSQDHFFFYLIKMKQ